MLAKSGIKTNAGRASLIMFDAELEAIACNGVMRGKQHTYALMDEKVPKGAVFTREEAIIELANRYFTSHAPAHSRRIKPILTTTTSRNAIFLNADEYARLRPRYISIGK